MKTYTIKPAGYPFAVEVTEAQLKEYTENVASSIVTLIDRLDEVKAFYDEAVTIGELWPYTEWEGMVFNVRYQYDTIVCDGVEKTLKEYIDALTLTYVDRCTDEWCGKLATELYNAISNK